MGYRTGWYDPGIEAQADRRDAYFSDDEWEPGDYTEEIDEAIGRENDQAGVFVHVEHRDQERDANESGRYPASVVERWIAAMPRGGTASLASWTSALRLVVSAL